jgi:RHS repeat-associated protein
VHAGVRGSTTRASTINNVVIFSASANTTSNINWLVADQLGTPRMVFDKTGALATTKRHDYLPFGEELFAGQGLRTSGVNGLGYTGDSIRQQFTSKERDDETGLDYFLARYYSSTQGRFTSIDPAAIKLRHLFNPQDLNRYSYVANNPLAFFDPDGKDKVTIIIRTFIPQKKLILPIPVRGDGRNVGDKGTHRTEFKITVETNTRKNNGDIFVGAPARDAGPSEGLTVSPVAVPGAGKFPLPGYGKSKSGNLEDNMQASANRTSRDTIELNATHAVPYPGVSGSPPIDYNLNITITDQNGQISMSAEGMHDGFPALEVFGVLEGSSNEQLVNSYDPRDTSQTGWELWGKPDTKLEKKTKKLEKDRP